MGLTNRSVGKGAVKNGISLEERVKRKVIALAGNPNVGKSTVFNALTGLRQHTGNWAGKTVSSAIGENKRGKGKYLIADIPGTYSLVAHSPEEEVARNFICFGKPDVTVVVCDATCLERNLNLVLQICEVNERVLLCINLLDEAERNGISIDMPLLSSRLGIDVVGIVARRKKSLDALLDKLDEALKTKEVRTVRKIEYPESIERAASIVEKVIKKRLCGMIDARWAALRLLEGERSICREIEKLCANENGKYKIDEDDELADALSLADKCLREAGLWGEMLSEAMASAFVRESEKVCDGVVKRSFSEYGGRDKRIDRLLTGRFSAYPRNSVIGVCV